MDDPTSWRLIVVFLCFQGSVEVRGAATRGSHERLQVRGVSLFEEKVLHISGSKGSNVFQLLSSGIEIFRSIMESG